MNSKLYGNEYKIPNDVIELIKVNIIKYPTSNGIKRAKNLVNGEQCTYQSLKRLKNYFDNFNGSDKIEYLLAGGDLMKSFVEQTLNNERTRVDKSEEIQRDFKIDANQGMKAQDISRITEGVEEIGLKTTASAIVFDSEKRILLLKRSSFQDQWEPNKFALIGGSIEDNEDPIQGILREIKEETGLVINKILEKFVIQRASNAVEHIYIAKYDGDPEDVLLNKEHAGFGWFTYPEIRYLNTVPNLVDYINIAISKY